MTPYIMKYFILVGCIDIDNVIRLTSTAVEVDWTIAFAPEAGEQYRVAYGLGGNPLTQSSVLVNAASGDPLEMYRLYIDGLDPTAEYCFQVQVVGAVPPDCSETQCISAPVGTCKFTFLFYSMIWTFKIHDSTTSYHDIIPRSMTAPIMVYVFSCSQYQRKYPPDSLQSRLGQHKFDSPGLQTALSFSPATQPKTSLC